MVIAMRRAMQQIDPRMRLALHLRFYEKQKLREVGEQIGVTRERARQIILEGLAEVRNRISGTHRNPSPSSSCPAAFSKALMLAIGRPTTPAQQVASPR
jgi:hypothetical protein